MYTSHPQRPRRNVFCCLLSTLFKTILGLVIAIGILFLLIWLIFRPKEIVVKIKPVSITRFNTTQNTTNLHFNLTTNISIYNPNKRIAIYYDTLESSAFYKGVKFSKDVLPSFYQGHKNSTTVRPSFEGRFNGTDVVSNALGIEVWLNGKVRFKYGSLTSNGRSTLRVKCGLKLNLVNGLNGDRYFNSCDVFKFF